ncbi:MAG TPA: HAD-IIIA family hydrolase [Cryomorphaceae bacterium]|nr:HAD-IIIA family hydrolase [Cryomorphaceae bacterium]
MANHFLALDPESLWDLVNELGVPFETLNTVDLEKREAILHGSDLKLIVLDVDGVFTDGGLFYSSSGEELKKFNVKDGMAITQAIKKGVQFGIISAASRSEVVEIRAQILGIQNVYVGKKPKIEVLESWLYKMGLGFENVAYLGDDVNDVDILKKVGVAACPSDAVLKVKNAAHIVLQNKGGCGCIREFVESYVTEIS